MRSATPQSCFRGATSGRVAQDAARGEAAKQAAEELCEEPGRHADPAAAGEGERSTGGQLSEGMLTLRHRTGPDGPHRTDVVCCASPHLTSPHRPGRAGQGSEGSLRSGGRSPAFKSPGTAPHHRAERGVGRALRREA